MGCGSDETWFDSSEVQNVQPNSGVHQAFHSMSIGGSFLRGKAARAGSGTLNTHVVWGLRMSGAIPPLCIHGEHRDKCIVTLTSIFKCYSQQTRICKSVLKCYYLLTSRREL